MDENIGSTCEMTVSTKELVKETAFQIVPNPAKDQISVLVDRNLIPAIENVFVMNNIGQRFQLANNKNELTFDISHLQAGIYFMEIHTKRGLYTQKIIIQ